jgi:cyclopropane fatty-acyl-phospholipid synthase-like methyltransferase
VLSGVGSVFSVTAIPRKLLAKILNRIKKIYNKDIVRMLDIPCGDFTWMSQFLSTRNDVNYTGIDIVPDLIENHKERFGNHKNKRFFCQDIVAEPLLDKYDLIFSRHMTPHLRTRDAMEVLKHFSENKKGYVLMTTMHIPRNYELVLDNNPMRYRPHNLELPPYSLVPPLCEESEGREVHEGVLTLWSLPLKQIK